MWWSPSSRPGKLTRLIVALLFLGQNLAVCRIGEKFLIGSSNKALVRRMVYPV